MIGLLLALATSVVVSFVGTPILTKFLIKHNMGQFIRDDLSQSHHVKRGTPSMGGIIIILATVLGFVVSAFFNLIVNDVTPGYSPFLLLFIMILMGLIGFIDDFLKIRKAQSEGLTIPKKLILQIVFGVIIGLLLISGPDENGQTPASFKIHIFNWELNFESLGQVLSIVIFLVWINFLMTAWTNAVNFTDGLDGLCAGVSLFSFGGFILIGIWEASQSCFDTSKSLEGVCYTVSHPFELATVAAAIVGACLGFLWYNTNPAKIFMGDTGSMALGGAFAGLSIMTHTEVISIFIGGMFFIELMSDVIQISSWKLFHKRVFKMAPIHHHFEIKGWQEITIVVRFWLITGFLMMLGLVLFYGAWFLSLQDI